MLRSLFRMSLLRRVKGLYHFWRRLDELPKMRAEAQGELQVRPWGAK